MGDFSVPALGLGTFGLTGAEATERVRFALELGYRHLDTAWKYDNEAQVGQGLRDSSVPREEVFVTTKIWPSDLAYDAARQAAVASLRRLGLEQVDLLLVHWPNAEVPLAETLRAFADIQAAGLARHVGVSNFPVALLREAIEEHGAPLRMNQVEYHPFLSQAVLRAYMRTRNVLLTAYLPLARGAVAQDATLTTIAEEAGRSAAQVALRWLLQQDDVVAIPRSSRPDRIRENLGALDFTLSPDQMARIDALQSNRRLVNPAFAPAWD